MNSLTLRHDFFLRPLSEIFINANFITPTLLCSCGISCIFCFVCVRNNVSGSQKLFRKIKLLPSQFKILPQIHPSYHFIFHQFLRNARFEDAAFEHQIGFIGDS